MIRREHSTNSSGFKNLSDKGTKQVSKLEEKKRRVQESESNPVVKKVTALDSPELERINDSKRLIKDEDEVPTGFLDEEDDADVRSTGSRQDTVDEDDVATGFLDEDEVEEGKSPKSLTVRKVDPDSVREVNKSSQYEDRNRDYEEGIDDGITRYTQSPQRQRRDVQSNGSTEGGMRNPVRRRSHGDNDRRQQQGYQQRGQSQGRVYSAEEEESYKGFVASEPPVRKGDLDEIPQERKSKGEKVKSKGTDKKQKGLGIILALMVTIAVIVVSVVGLVVFRYMNNDNSGSSGSSAVTLDVLTGLVDSLYTDATKVDIQDWVGDSDIQDCINALEGYKSDKNFSDEEYGRLSQEIGTISFFLQDKSLYNSLQDGTYAPGTDEYTKAISTIKNDIYLYTVVGLADTMTTKLQILETTSKVEPSNNNDDAVNDATQQSESNERNESERVNTEAPQTETKGNSDVIDVPAGSDSVIIDSTGSTSDGNRSNSTESSSTESNAESEKQSEAGVNVSDILNSLGSEEK